ncbi:MAG TPA: hypothetical protein P5250_02480, partial [Bacteroidales bacterium]|nr:hypothetical protein [Bacteroidales bacterium]
MIDEKRIYLIGAGNIGINMGIALKRVGFSFSGVFSRSEDKGFMVSKKLRCKYVNNLYDIPDNTNIIIFALPDNVLIEVAGKFKASKQIVIHTAGSVDISILLKTSKNIGVFYPLQTFSANRKISFKDVPV